MWSIWEIYRIQTHSTCMHPYLNSKSSLHWQAKREEEIRQTYLKKKNTAYKRSQNGHMAIKLKHKNSRAALLKRVDCFFLHFIQFQASRDGYFYICLNWSLKKYKQSKIRVVASEDTSEKCLFESEMYWPQHWESQIWFSWTPANKYISRREFRTVSWKKLFF